MTQNEIKDFKKFMNDQDAYQVFEKTYNENRMTFNPKKLEDYLELTQADIVIPQAFIYPETVYDKNFWLALHDKWKKRLNQKRAEHSEAVQLEDLDLEVIDIHSKSSCLGLPKDTCSLSLRGGKRLTLNMEHSKMVAKKLSTHMLLTRSRQTTDVVLMFNRQRGIEVKFYDKFIVMQSKVRSIPDNQMFVRLLLTSTSHNNSQCPRSLSQSRRSLLFSHSLSESRLGRRSAYAFSSASRLALESALA